jgi:methionine-rich copper-binding protein CopC
MNRVPVVSTFAALAFLFSSQAFAHAFLTTASPAVGSTVSHSPKQVRLNFTEGLEAAFSSVHITGPGGARDFGRPRIAGKKMIVPVLRPLAPGVYRVVWHATALDTHKTQGSFNFTIKR